MLAHKLQNLTNMSPMNLYIGEIAFFMTVYEHVIEVARCEIAHRAQQICHASVESGRRVGEPLWHH